VIARVLTVRSRLPRRRPRTAVFLLPPSPSMDRPVDQVVMARARNGRFGKAIDERVDVGAVLCKGAHDKRLYTSELTQTALDGAGAHLLAIWPELPVEALGVSGSIYRHCPRPSVRCTTRCPLSWTSPVRSTSPSPWCSAPVAVVQSLHLEEDCLRPAKSRV
jgi:hypothetical protein